MKRLAILERLGTVPENADSRDWMLAQKTTWWGKRLDPHEFWKNRTVWLDQSAVMAAHRQGRLYPPIPYDDPLFASRSDSDGAIIPGADEPDVRFRRSDRESAFWDLFAKTHPAPPGDILEMQRYLAHRILGTQQNHQAGTTPSVLRPAEIDTGNQIERSRALAVGYPAEAVTDEVLRWTYVLDKRAQYEQLYLQNGARNALDPSNFLALLWVDPKLITQPLTHEQLNAANHWKIPYLQRLRRGKTDQSYINAYLQAWNLSAAEVFK